MWRIGKPSKLWGEKAIAGIAYFEALTNDNHVGGIAKF